MTSKRILFQFFRDQAESEKGREGGGMAEVGQKEEEKGYVTLISVKIIFTAFCMHLTLFNQVDVHVEFCYLSVNGADLSECMYFIF